MRFRAWISWQRDQIEISDGCSPLHGRVQAAAYFPSLISSSSPSWVMGSVYGLAVEQLKHLEKHGYPELSRLEVASYSHLIQTLSHFHILGTDMCATAQEAVPHTALEQKRQDTAGTRHSPYSQDRQTAHPQKSTAASQHICLLRAFCFLGHTAFSPESSSSSSNHQLLNSS